MTFELIAGSEGARAGLLKLPSGLKVETPSFMPVATKLSVKTLSPMELEKIGVRMLITNGFLSHLEPGSDLLREFGGMREFMRWNGGVFSDSGGFQFIRKGFSPVIDDEGVEMNSPFSGERIRVTPGDVVDFHVKHGVDVGMVLDHCPPYPSERDTLSLSSRRTVLWARRSLERIRDPELKDLLPENMKRLPQFFAITQGGCDGGLRKKCTRRLVEMDFPGYGIGGLSIGEEKDMIFRMLQTSTSYIPVERPRYFMGVGDPDDVIRSIRSGVDIFDSVFPTRNARHRSVFTYGGRENIRAGRWKGIGRPIMEGCDCETCRNYTRGFIYHLFKAGEPLGQRLTTIHNLRFMSILVKAARRNILEGGLSEDSNPGELVDECLRSS